MVKKAAGCTRVVGCMVSVMSLASCGGEGGDSPRRDPAPSEAPVFETVSFASTDSLTVTADFYSGASRDAATVLLYHQSASSRGEYREIAPHLQDLGYNVLAVDLRWGRERAGVVNETARRAETPNLIQRVEAGEASPWPTIDRSYGDMVASLRWLGREGYSGARVAVGSSFSAMLVYRLAAEEELAGAVAFSPGEYDEARPTWVSDWASRVEVPVLSVAALEESDLVEPVASVTAGVGSYFYQATIGRHGASILDEDARNLSAFLSFVSHVTGGPPRRDEIDIPAAAGGRILADLYEAPGDSAIAILFHQGGASGRGEYGFLVPQLLDMGFDVLTPDLPGGGDRFGWVNRTLVRHPEAPTFTYCDALPDVRAVIDLAREVRPDARVILWGSSYSGALVLHAAASDPTIDRVLSFSPADGEPMAGCGAGAAMDGIEAPVLAVRPESEAQIEAIRAALAGFEDAGHVTHVATPGRHGSSTLNPFRVGAPVDAAWTVVHDFLIRPH